MFLANGKISLAFLLICVLIHYICVKIRIMGRYRSNTELQTKISDIKTIIDQLEAIMADHSLKGKSGIYEYQFNDGQSIVRHIYQQPTELTNAINEWEKMLIKYTEQLNGRVAVLRDRSTFNQIRQNGY